LYAYPRYEYDQRASAIAIGFEEAYTGDISGLFTVSPIQSSGFKGEQVVYIYDFSVIAQTDLNRLLSEHKGQKIIFYEKPYELLKASQLAVLLDQYDITVGYLELNPVSDFIRQTLLLRDSQNREKLFRVHTIKPAEVTKLGLDYEMVLRRWLRARDERSIDFFWVQPLPDSIGIFYDEYGVTLLGLFRTTSLLSLEPVRFYEFFRVLLIAGCIGLIVFYSPIIGLLCGIFLVIFGLQNGWMDMNLYLAGLAGTFGITGIFREMRKLEYHPMLKYIALIICTIFLGVTINALSYSFESVNGLLLPHGVKLMTFYLPSLVLLREFLHYGIRGLRTRLHWSDFVLVIGIILVILYSLMRSGNYAFVTGFERKLRDSLEMFLGVRPRFREIIGIPALWLYFRKKHLAFGRYAFVVPVLGAIGICSIVNSFQHVHTPINVIFLREMLGIVIGTAIGILFGVFLPVVEEGEST
jgi:hypothetical protein